VRLEQATLNPWSESDEDESEITRSSGQQIHNPASCCSPTDTVFVIQGMVLSKVLMAVTMTNTHLLGYDTIQPGFHGTPASILKLK
jgi:hypothetical protein